MTDERPTVLSELYALRAAAYDWRLSRGDIGVLAVILKHADQEGVAWPGPSLIATTAGLAVSNVKASLQRLELLRYIEIERPGIRKKNRFIVLDSPRVPSKQSTRIIEETRRSLGMRAGPIWVCGQAPNSLLTHFLTHRAIPSNLRKSRKRTRGLQAGCHRWSHETPCPSPPSRGDE